MIRSSTFVRLGAAIALLGGSGCGLAAKHQFEKFFEETTLRKPFEADLEVIDVDPASVRAGLFAAPTTATEIEGDAEEREADLEVLDRDDARVLVGLPFGATKVSLAPLEPAEVDGAHVRFTLPELDADTDLVPVVWVDSDGNGRLDVAEDGGEAARSLVRDDDGERLYLDLYYYDAAEDAFFAHTSSSDDGLKIGLVQRDDLDDWVAVIDRATDEPG